MSIVKIQRKGQMTLPTGVRTAVGLADGDLVDVKVSGRRIIVTPMLVVDRSKFPSAEDEYTPEQRRMINARLAESERGPYYGPFKSGAEVAAFLKKWKGNKPGKLKKTG
jgi:AbrB family looped-hinge helix DNA binding protein